LQQRAKVFWFFFSKNNIASLAIYLTSDLPMRICPTCDARARVEPHLPRTRRQRAATTRTTLFIATLFIDRELC
jgi:hypothetical protein